MLSSNFACPEIVRLLSESSLTHVCISFGNFAFLFVNFVEVCLLVFCKFGQVLASFSQFWQLLSFLVICVKKMQLFGNYCHVLAIVCQKF